ncbi:acyltransferase family protein [Mucilaginibacter sp.]|uniref:acyltransferase family protein n=1 Tax=Mucilaginibacter sp. TaxID=1882438 RepID=UPI003D11C21D
MGRIKILDGFRCVAILIVILFHFTSVYANQNTLIYWPYIVKKLYPYGSKYAGYFEFGHLGVQLFFMISGFVIYMTLEKTNSFSRFIIKRFLRLFPLLLLCSIITYIAPFLLDPEKRYLIFHRPAHNFLPSLSFTDLWMWNIILKTKSVEYI